MTMFYLYPRTPKPDETGTVTIKPMTINAEGQPAHFNWQRPGDIKWFGIATEAGFFRINDDAEPAGQQ